MNIENLSIQVRRMAVSQMVKAISRIDPWTHSVSQVTTSVRKAVHTQVENGVFDASVMAVGTMIVQEVEELMRKAKRL